jgi:hypothetical protein
MSSSFCCVVSEHAAGVVRGESGFDLFWGAARLDTFWVVFPDGRAIQILLMAMTSGRWERSGAYRVLCFMSWRWQLWFDTMHILHSRGL